MSITLLSTASVLRLVRFIPLPGLRLSLLESYWDRYWLAEERQEAKALGFASGLRIRGSERAMLIESIARCYPFETLLEVGCGYAQNFHILPSQYPAARFVGLDIDPERIEEGSRELASKGITQAVLEVGDVTDLSAFADSSVDVVISCAMLLFVPPEKIERAIGEMLRVASKAVVVLEQHQVNPENPTQALGVRIEQDTGRSEYYLRDYQSLFERFVQADRIEACAILQPRWQLEQWQQYAYVFHVVV